MKLLDLLSGIGYKVVCGSTDIEIASVKFDSRKVGPGDLFVAEKGYVTDGHEYIGAALQKGASAIVCEDCKVAVPEGVTCIVVDSTVEVLGKIAGNFYNVPSSKMILVGVTGTNGKTTTATLLYDLVKLFGRKAGLLSTVCNYIGDRKVPSTHTTPDPVSINALMAEMVAEGCEYCFMEVSSHSAHQHRIAGLDFNGAVFTNLTHDHLDYHKTFKNYIAAKKMFFDGLGKEAFALVNSDDRNGMVMLQNCKGIHKTYACHSMADYRCRIIERRLDSMLLEIDGGQVWTKFTGDFNAYNLLAVYSVARMLGFPKEDLLIKISKLHPVAGRFETFVSGKGVVAVVDYAHTPDALDNVLSTLKEIRHEGRIVCVVGAGGDRDRTKRPEMAGIAVQKSDVVYLTSDNPRSEEPEAIIADMLEGVSPENRSRVRTVVDRKQAMTEAVRNALKGDIILVAGKGHEDYQEIKGVRHHFDDREIIKELLKEY